MLKSLLTLFLQSKCPLCERSTNQILCQYCQNQVINCQLKNPCLFWQGDLPLFVWGNYEGRLKQAITSFKYQNHPEIGELMGRWLGETWLNSSIFKKKKFMIVPIPLHAQKLKERGFNQAELIAKGFCQVTHYSLQSQGLIRTKETQALFSLNPLERSKQINQAFQIGKDLKKSHSVTPILLLDDIYTTGTTAKEATKTLRSNGYSVAGIITLSSSKQKNL